MAIFAVKVCLFLCSIIVIFEPSVAQLPNTVTTLAAFSHNFASRIYLAHDKSGMSEQEIEAKIKKLEGENDPKYANISEKIKKTYDDLRTRTEIQSLSTNVNLTKDKIKIIEKLRDDVLYNMKRLFRLIDDAKVTLEAVLQKLSSYPKKNKIMVFSGYGSLGSIADYIALCLINADYDVFVATFSSSNDPQEDDIACTMIHDLLLEAKLGKSQFVNVEGELQNRTKSYNYIGQVARDCSYFLEGLHDGVNDSTLASGTMELEFTSNLLNERRSNPLNKIFSLGAPLSYPAHTIICINFFYPFLFDNNNSKVIDVETLLAINKEFYEHMEHNPEIYKDVKDDIKFQNYYYLADLFVHYKLPTPLITSKKDDLQAPKSSTNSEPNTISPTSKDIMSDVLDSFGNLTTPTSPITPKMVESEICVLGSDIYCTNSVYKLKNASELNFRVAM